MEVPRQRRRSGTVDQLPDEGRQVELVQVGVEVRRDRLEPAEDVPARRTQHFFAWDDTWSAIELNYIGKMQSLGQRSLRFKL